MFKRVALFLLTNVLVIATLSIVTNLLGLHSYLSQRGIDYSALAIFCAVWGTGGAFISLLLSKFMAKHAMGVRVLDPNSTTSVEKQLLNTVYRLANRAGLTQMPEVGIYDSPELNAFATGPSKRRALVAVSTGLLDRMNSSELEGVLGHEISHVANGDMVTMTLIQGIVNAFAMFLSRIVAYVISMALSSNDERSDGQGFSYFTFYALTFLFDIVFTLLGSLVTAAFSRWREYRADAGGARVASKSSMLAALEKLKSAVDVEDNRAPSMATLKISRRPKAFQWFSSHPPLEARIKRLEGAFSRSPLRGQGT